jgi:hypothetical protein
MSIKSIKQNLNFNQKKIYNPILPFAEGGTVTEYNDYTIHTFTSTDSFTLYAPIATIEYLIVAGGGSGGTGDTSNPGCGGGGAGGVLTGTLEITSGEYSIVVGAGGVAPTYTGGSITGNSGSNSSAFGIETVGGGGGGNFQGVGLNGGSGGGGGGRASIAGGKGIYPRSTFIAAARQGYDGGRPKSLDWPGESAGGGGGGAGGAGSNGTGTTTLSYGGAGGPGIYSEISGTNTAYGGGGGGGSNNGGTNSGGVGGGGDGAVLTGAPTSGTENTGSGGGGAHRGNAGGNGGSGIVIFRYRKN